MPPWVWKEHEARYEFAARFVGGKTVVDCACGAALGSRRFAAAGAEHVAAFDVDRLNVATISRDGAPRLSFGAGSAASLPLRSGAIDVFICLETIEHVQDDEAVVKEAARVLQADGVFICSTPNRLVTNPGATRGDRPLNPYHVREYSPDEFHSLLSSGFGRIEAWGQNPGLGVVPRLLRRFPHPLGARTAQVLKLPRLVVDRQDHSVRAVTAAPSWEYLVAVCRAPKRRAS